jgi:hypothetical protein
MESDHRDHERGQPPKDWSLFGVSIALGLGAIALVLIVVVVWLTLGPVWFGANGE